MFTRRTILLVFSLAMLKVLCAQQYDGIYVEDTTGNFIQIDGDHFVVRTILQGDFGDVVVNDGDTIADCIITPISNELFEINSLFTRSQILRSASIEQYECDTIDWRICKYVIDAPINRSRLKAKFWAAHNECDFTFSKKNNSIVTVVRDRTVFLTLSLIDKVTTFDIDEFYGVPQDLVIPFTYKFGNHTVIHIPLLTDAYFRTLQIKGEFVRVVDGNLLWRSHIFKKRIDGSLPTRSGWIMQ